LTVSWNPAIVEIGTNNSAALESGASITKPYPRTFIKQETVMTDVFFFTDADGSEWIRNLDGTFRCLNAEIRSMKLDDIKREFGPISAP
jgi:hypothetical protein